MIFFHEDDVGHEVIVIDLDLQFLSHLIEPVPD
jgi:hypothetical protein